MTASRILATKGGDVFVVSPSDTLADGAKTLSAHNIGAAVVVDGQGLPLGVFSERDLARQIADKGVVALAQPIEAIMSRRLITATPSASFDSLMELMTQRRVRHIIILEDDILDRSSICSKVENHSVYGESTSKGSGLTDFR